MSTRQVTFFGQQTSQLLTGSERFSVIGSSLRKKERNLNRKSANSPVFVAMAIMSIAFGILQAKQLPKKVKSTECGPPSQGFQLCVQLDKRQVKVGEPVLLRIAIKNITKQELTLGEATPEVENRATITNRNGGIVMPTAKGKRLISRGDWCCHSSEIMVGPGQVHNETLAIDKLFEVSTIDTYSISIRRFVGKLDESGVVDLTSNRVTLKVTN